MDAVVYDTTWMKVATHAIDCFYTLGMAAIAVHVTCVIAGAIRLRSITQHKVR